jgi:uncharacterized RmlC-like cupin family protein
MSEHIEPIGTELLYSDGEVRIWNLELEPSGRTEVHQHPCDYVYVVIAPGSTETHHANGHVDAVVDAVGDHIRHGMGVPHQLINVGGTRYRNIIVEILSEKTAPW